MKKIIPVACILFLINFNLSLFATTPQTKHSDFASDSLVLKKNNSKKEKIIFSGKKIKIWKQDNRMVKGVFLNIDNHSLTLIDKKNNPIKVLLSDIQKIKIIGSLFKQIAAGVLLGIGIIGASLGTILLVASLGSGYGGSIVAAVAGIVGGVGAITLTPGILLLDKKYDLEKKWSIQTN